MPGRCPRSLTMGLRDSSFGPWQKPNPRSSGSAISTGNAFARRSSGGSRSPRWPGNTSISIRCSLRGNQASQKCCADAQTWQSMGRYALKYDEEFLVADELGDITGEGDGLFYNDTRLLSR